MSDPHSILDSYYAPGDGPRGPRAPRSLPPWRGGVQVKHPAHGLTADINPEDLELAKAAGWVEAAE